MSKLTSNDPPSSRTSNTSVEDTSRGSTSGETQRKDDKPEPKMEWVVWTKPLPNADELDKFTCPDDCTCGWHDAFTRPSARPFAKLVQYDARKKGGPEFPVTLPLPPPLANVPMREHPNTNLWTRWMYMGGFYHISPQQNTPYRIKKWHPFHQ